MVIQCSSCQTRFRLADEKVKEGGTRVRCSRCGQVFSVMRPAPEPAPEPPPKPAAEPTGTVAAGAEPRDRSGHETPPDESAADEGDSATGLDFDFEKSAAADFGEPGADTDTERREDDFDAPDGEDVDYDAFAFDEPDAGPASESVSFDEISFEEGVESSFPSEAESGAANETGGAEPEEEDFSDFDFDSPEAGEEQDFSFESDLGGGVRDEFSFEDEEPPLPDFDTVGDREEAGADELAGAGQPDEFAFGDTGSVLEESGENDLDFSTAAPAETESPAASPATEAEGPAAKPAAKPAHPPKGTRGGKKYPRKKRKAGSRLPLLLLLLLLVAGGAAGYLYWIGQLPQVDRLLAQVMGEAPQVAEANQIRVTDLDSYFVNNRRVGQFFVIDGTAVNGHQDPRSALAVRGILFDQNGSVLREKTVYCGNPLTRDELQTLDWPQIRERTDNQFGDSLSNLNVAPGKGVPFTIVFKDLPQNLAEFNVEPADSIAGDQ